MNTVAKKSGKSKGAASEAEREPVSERVLRAAEHVPSTPKPRMELSRHRNAMLLALGSPEEPDAKDALEIVLEGIHADASALADLYTSKLTGARQIALSCRLEALKAFVHEYVTVEWAEGGAS